MAERFFGCDEDLSFAFSDQHEQPRQVGATTLEDFNLGDAHRVPNLDSVGETPRSDLHWLCLTMILLKA